MTVTVGSLPNKEKKNSVDDASKNKSTKCYRTRDERPNDCILEARAYHHQVSWAKVGNWTDSFSHLPLSGHPAGLARELSARQCVMKLAGGSLQVTVATNGVSQRTLCLRDSSQPCLWSSFFLMRRGPHSRHILCT